ncbi:DUF4440 domain-containing protein [Sphingomonas sp. ASV193]|uniref:nuclear transport factor 2 family protein n=1 Tax=Sphingomonas sp. ASV193 TaxID=3144405 RepID=UPI0032E8F2DB
MTMATRLSPPVLALTISLLAASPAVAETVSQLLLRKTQAFSDAGQRGDGTAMAAMLDDHLVFFNESGDQASKSDLAASTPSTGSSGITTRMTITDWHCEVHGDVAVASFIDDQQQDWHGQPFHARYRSVETWRHAGKDWKMIASETIALVDDPTPVSLPGSTLQDYVGRYEAAPGIEFSFTRDGDTLFAATAGSPPTRQEAEIKDVFFTPGRSRTRKLFERDATGRITGFLLRREGHDLRFRRL